MLLVKCQLFVSFLALNGNNITLSSSSLSSALSFSLVLCPFVVSSPGLVLNVDVRDELLGYAADVRRYAVSCLQPHLEISFPLPHRPLRLFSAAKNASIETNPKSADDTFSHFWPPDSGRMDVFI